MSDRELAPSENVTRLNGLLAWWGFTGKPGGDPRPTPLSEGQRLAGSMGRIVADATAAQAGLVREAGLRNAQSLTRILFARRRCDLVEAQSQLIADCVGDVSSHAQIWSDLMQALERETRHRGEVSETKRDPSIEQQEPGTGSRKHRRGG